MITNSHIVDKFEKDFAAGEALSLEQKFALLNSLYSQARSLGHFNESDMMEGMDADIELARILNAHVPVPSR